MKLKIVFAFLVFITIHSFGQTKSSSKSATTATQTIALKTLADSASYALGLNIAGSLNKDMGDINTTLLIKAMQDAFAKKPALLDEDVCYTVLNTYSQKMQESKYKAALDEGNIFLADNKKKAGVITTASGLQYEIITQGNGEKPTLKDTVVCHYRGTLLDGTEFDASYNRGEPLTIPIEGVIKGWTEGLQLMPKGAKYKFYIPQELAYGLRGAPPTIPGGSALIFEIELLDVIKAR